MSADLLAIPRITSRYSARAMLDPKERLEALIERVTESGCWIWIGGEKRNGYGAAWLNGRLRQAHRAVFEVYSGKIAEGLVLDHLCRVRCCVNPLHLQPVSMRENLLRGHGNTAKNAAKTHCPSGHPYDFANTYLSPKGARKCRECGRLDKFDKYQPKRGRRA